MIRAGEFQRVTAVPGVSHSALNASRSQWVHFFQLSFSAAPTQHDRGLEQKRFSTASRRGGLCAVASQDARQGSLRTEQDILVFSALLDPGQHVVHELSQDRAVWLHIAHGEATLGGLHLAAGDGCGVQGTCSVSLTARGQTEVLLVDLVPSPVAAQAPSEN
jgi:redox-sensitive bicupin YhaK (pirin superfamily)